MLVVSLVTAPVPAKMASVLAPPLAKRFAVQPASTHKPIAATAEAVTTLALQVSLVLVVNALAPAVKAFALAFVKISALTKTTAALAVTFVHPVQTVQMDSVCALKGASIVQDSVVILRQTMATAGLAVTFARLEQRAKAESVFVQPLGKPSVVAPVATFKRTATTAGLVGTSAPLAHHAPAVLVAAQADKLLALVRV